MRRRAPLLVAAAAAMALVVRVLHGPGYLGYDALWALRWGHEILHLHAPAFAGPDAPTPHPLANLVSALLSVLGPDAATTGLLALSWLALGALAVVLARLGAELFSWPVGVLAAAAILSRQLLWEETAQAFVDLPFLALSVAALEREVRRPRAGPAVAVMLVLAGLLRPEGWALELVYLLYRWSDLAPAGRARLAALLAVAPALWAGMDLWGAGDALHSLRGTRALAAEFDRPRGGGTAITGAPAALRDLVQTPLLWVALAGALGGLLSRERASRIPGGVVIVGLAGFLVLGVAGLPLLDRYLLLPAAMLLLFAGLAVFGATTPGPNRRAWLVGGAVAGAVTLAGVPGDVGELRTAKRFGARLESAQDALRAAARATDGRDCARALAPDLRAAAAVRAQRLDVTPGDGGTLVFTYEREALVSDYALGPVRERTDSGRVVFRNRDWVVAARGC